MTMLIKIHDILKCQRTKDSEQIPKIDGVEDFQSAELALQETETRLKVVSYTLQHTDIKYDCNFFLFMARNIE